MGKLGVLIPCYNVENYIDKCLESILNQDYKDIEILLVNDGSTDNTKKVLKEYEKKYNFIKVITQENKGLSTVRKVLLDNINTEYITFIDSDDYVDTNMFSDMMSKFKKDIDIVICNAMRVDENGNDISEFKLYENKTNDVKKNLMLSHPSVWGKIFRTKLFTENNLNFLTTIRTNEDMPVTLPLCKYINKIVYIDKPYYKYLIRTGSILHTKKFNTNMLDLFKVFEYLDDKFDDYKEEYEYNYLKHLVRGEVKRLLPFEEGIPYLNEISKIIKEKYPNYKNNYYFKNSNFKFKLFCNLAINKHFKLLKLLLK